MLVEKVHQAKASVVDDKSGSAGQEPFSKKLKEVREKAPGKKTPGKEAPGKKEGMLKRYGG